MQIGTKSIRNKVLTPPLASASASASGDNVGGGTVMDLWRRAKRSTSASTFASTSPLLSFILALALALHLCFSASASGGNVGGGTVWDCVGILREDCKEGDV